jgi:hypothetical protein
MSGEAGRKFYQSGRGGAASAARLKTGLARLYRVASKQESRRAAGFLVCGESARQRVTTTLVELALLAASRATAWIVWLPAATLRVFQL